MLIDFSAQSVVWRNWSAPTGRGRRWHGAAEAWEGLEPRMLLAAAPMVQGFSLIDADTDQPVISLPRLTNGAVLDLSALPTTRLNVQADVAAGAGSVRFGYDAIENYHLENGAPFAMAGNNGADYFAWTPAVGDHTIRATAFGLRNGGGEVGNTVAVSFRVVAGGASTPAPSPPAQPAPPPPPPAAPAPPAAIAITRLTLVNAQTDRDIAPLDEGATIDFSGVGKLLSIRADTSPSVVGSVVFNLDGAKKIENAAPYTIAGDVSGNILNWTPSLGGHTLIVTPYSAAGGGGLAGAPLTLHFTVGNGTPAPAPAPADGFRVSSTPVGVTGLDLAWTAPVGFRPVEYRVSYIPGAYTPGPTDGRRVLIVDGKTTTARLSGLQSYTLYSVDVTAVDAAGPGRAAHLNAWTAAPASLKRYLYAFGLPKNRQGFTTLKPQIEVFDINAGHKWVKNIPLPSGIYNVRGVAANALTNRMYVAYHTVAHEADVPGGLLAMDLTTGAVLWRKDYTRSVIPSPDRFDLTPDGSRIYMPGGESGSADFWVVLDARTGEPLGRIHHTTSPHNTIVSLDGRRVFLEGQEKAAQAPSLNHTVGVVDAASNTVIQRVGPFRDVIRPFTINGKGSLIFATVDNFIGFQIGDVATGRVLYTAAVPGVAQPTPAPHQSVTHGIAITPDEREVWVVDVARVGFRVWDVSQAPGGPPRYVGFVPVRKSGRNLAGAPDPAASNDAAGVPGWITSGYDGRWLYAEGGEIIDPAAHKVVGQLRGMTRNAAGQVAPGPYTHSRFMLEVQFDGGAPVRATNQFGVGRVR